MDKVGHPLPLQGSASLLIAHVTAMLFTVLIGIGTGLGALFAPGNIRTLV